MVGFTSDYWKNIAYKDVNGNIKQYIVDNRDYPRYSVYGLRFGEQNAKKLAILNIGDCVDVNGKVIMRFK